MRFQQIDREAFVIARYDSVQQRAGTVQLGPNLVLNGNFERGDLSNWTASNFSIADEANVPPPHDEYGALATSSGTTHVAALASLTSAARIAVTANQRYLVTVFYGAARRTSGAGRRKPNILRVTVKWYDAVSGGALIRAQKLRNAAVRGNNKFLRGWTRAATAPGGAAGAELVIENRHFGGPSGTPGGALLDDVAFQAELTDTDTQALEEIKHRDVAARGGASFSDLKFSKSHRVGHKACSFTLRGESAYLFDWLGALEHEILVRYDDQTCFQGLVWRVSGTIDGTAYDADLGQVFNQINVPYGDAAAKRYATATDRNSIARFGRKDYYESELYDTGREGQRRANTLLRLYKDGLPQDDFNDARGENNALTVTCVGNFATLDFITSLRSPFARNKEMKQMIATGTNSILNQVRALGNVFIANDYGLLEATGNEVGPFVPEENVEQSALELVTKWLDEGDDTGALLVSGVGADRKFFLRARPTTATYQMEQRNGKREYRDASGARVPQALVEAGHFMTRAQPVPDFARYNDIAVNPRARFLSEIEYDAENDALRLTMLGQTNLGKRVARLTRNVAQLRVRLGTRVGT